MKVMKYKLKKDGLYYRLITDNEIAERITSFLLWVVGWQAFRRETRIQGRHKPYLFIVMYRKK